MLVTDPIKYPSSQRNAFRPRHITGILYDWAIKKIADAIRAVVADLQRWAQHDPASGSAPARRAKRRSFFLPVEFTAAPPSRLSRPAVAELLGTSKDRALVDILAHGFVISFDAELQIVITPQLPSLAMGLDWRSDDLKRLIDCGYFAAVPPIPDHTCTVADERLVVALGFLPCRCAAQGTVERPLDPGRPRGIEDGGQPRKPEKDSEGVAVRAVNEIANPKAVDPATRRRRLPHERKPSPRSGMVANAILQFTGRV